MEAVSQSNYTYYPFKDKISPRIYQFISTIYATAIIDISQLTLEKYQEFVYPKLGITRYSSLAFMQKKLAVARQYARILKNYYKPDLQLIQVITKVFREHLMNRGILNTTGIALEIDNTKYYAKLTTGNICILEGKGKKLGEGSHGEVWKVYDIVTRKMLALKWAHLDFPEASFYMNHELDNLKKIHKINSARTTPLEGLQDPFLAEFDLPNLFGYAGPQYNMDLATFVDSSNASNSERLALCKKLMKVFHNIDKLGLWHGDYKLDNIMLKNGQPVVIDWAGAVLLHEAATDFTKPLTFTPCYMSSHDTQALLKMLEEKNSITDIQVFRNKFIQTAKSLELFTIAIVLFVVLTSEFPFTESTFPETEKGISESGLNNLNAYSDKIVQVMKTMLAHHPKDRLNSTLAFSVWESIT